MDLKTKNILGIVFGAIFSCFFILLGPIFFITISRGDREVRQLCQSGISVPARVEEAASHEMPGVGYPYMPQPLTTGCVLFSYQTLEGKQLHSNICGPGLVPKAGEIYSVMYHPQLPGRIQFVSSCKDIRDDRVANVCFAVFLSLIGILGLWATIRIRNELIRVREYFKKTPPTIAP